MKFTPVIVAILIAGQMALGATSKKVKRIIYEDGTTSTTSVSTSKAYDQNRFFRRIIPEIGLLFGDATIKSNGMRTGLNVGVVGDILGTHELVLETGLLYRQMGTTLNNMTLAYNYITVPVSGKYYLFGQEANGIYFKGGVTPGFNVAASRSTDNGQSTDMGKETNTFDFGFLLAVGGKYNFNRQLAVILEGYYNRGLTNIENYQDNTPGNTSVNTLAFGVSTGLSVEL